MMTRQKDFYPRPPGGGRLVTVTVVDPDTGFLSTPSGWRATRLSLFYSILQTLFLSTPSGWRATCIFSSSSSILLRFLSTPSGWRATAVGVVSWFEFDAFLSTPSGWRATTTRMPPRKVRQISIHALRVEGDLVEIIMRGCKIHFYPRPPGGGRRTLSSTRRRTSLFLSTPSGWRAT